MDFESLLDFIHLCSLFFLLLLFLLTKHKTPDFFFLQGDSEPISQALVYQFFVLVALLDPQ